MKKILLLLLAVVLWSCTDYAADWDEKYEAAISQQSKTPILPAYSICKEGETTSLTDENCTANLVCQNDFWVPISYVCNDRNSQQSSSSNLPTYSICKEGETTLLVDEKCIANLACQNDSWVTILYICNDGNNEFGFMTDVRDGQTYKIAAIGSQTWMAENLNYETVDSYCYDDDVANCSKYGRLYKWAAAVGYPESECGYGYECPLLSENIQGACPSGWHLPSKTEWEMLFNAVGGQSTAAKVLKSTSGWNGDANGTDVFEFSVLPAGYRNYNKRYYYVGGRTHFWSSTEDFIYNAYNVGFYENDDAGMDSDKKNDGRSIRCVKDDASGQNPISSSSMKLSSSSALSGTAGGILTDPRDGQTYKTVKIGSQTWMAKNLNYNASGSTCYNSLPSNCETYGRLYSQKIAKASCPSGWHLPSSTEWKTLLNNVSPSSSLLAKNNSSGFAALLAGSSKNAPGTYAIFWTSDTDKSANIGTTYNGVYSIISGELIYVRCLQD